MSNELEALGELEVLKEMLSEFVKHDLIDKAFNTIKNYILETQELKSEYSSLLEENKDLYVELAFTDKQNKELIEDLKQLNKKLEIIFYKGVNIRILQCTKTYKEYNDRLLRLDPNLPTEIYFITEEEFNLLRR